MTPIHTSLNKLVCFYPISIKTAEPIGPIFCLQQEKNLPCKNIEFFYLEIYKNAFKITFKKWPILNQDLNPKIVARRCARSVLKTYFYISIYLYMFR